MNANSISLGLLRETLTNPHAYSLTKGSPAHAACLGFTASVLRHTQNEDLIYGAVESLLPESYDGNSLDEVRGMIRSAIAKGMHKRMLPPISYDPGDEGPEPMGYLENGSYVFLDQPRRILVTETSNRLTSLSTLMNLAPRRFWEGQFPKMKEGKIISADSILAADVLMRECREKGGFDPGQVRGRGVYREDDNIIVNFGGPVPRGTGYRYVCWLPININVEEGAEFDATPVLTLLEHFSWSNASFPYLLMGWAVLAPICGVLRAC